MVVVFFGKFCSVTDQQVRGWLAARWTIIGRRCRLADRGPRRSHPGCGHLGAGGRLFDWHPGDRLPDRPGEPLVLPPVSPAEPADPGAIPQRRRHLSSDPGIPPLLWRRQRRLRPPDRPDAVADTDPSQCARFAGASYSTVAPQPASLPRRAGASSAEADQEDQQAQGDHYRTARAARGAEE